MQGKIYSIPYDVKQGVKTYEVFNFTSEDNGSCQFDFTISNKEVAYDLTGTIVRLVAKSPTGVTIQQDCTVETPTSGKASILLLQSFFSTPGKWIAELQIYNSADQTLRLSLPQFTYRVGKSLMDDETVEASDEFSLLRNMIINVSDASTVATQALDTANTALVTADDAVTIIGTQITAVDTAVTEVNTLKTEMTPFLGDLAAAKTKLEDVADGATKDVFVTDGEMPLVINRNKNTFYWLYAIENGVKVFKYVEDADGNRFDITQEMEAKIATLNDMVQGVIDTDITAVLNNELVATDIENKLNAKEVEYTPRLTSAENQLELTENKLNLSGWELQNKTRKLTPLVTFVDDDGRKEVLTKLLPLSQTYNIPMVTAVIGGRAMPNGDVNCMKQDDLLMLQNLGWEISGHTQTHRHLETLTYSEQVAELKVGKETLENMGLKVSTLCYPFSGRNDDTVKIAREYYRCGRITDSKGRINLAPLETFDMPAMPLGSYFDTWTTPPFPTNSLDYYKWSVDQAVANNGWLIIMTHCADAQHTATQQQYLEQTIQYIKSLNIDVVTMDEGLNRRGNIVDIGRYYTASSLYRKHLAIGCDGSYAGSELQNVVEVTQFAVTNATPPKDFRGRKIYHTRISNFSGVEGFPSSLGGTLITDTTGKAHPVEGYAHQLYKVRNTNDVYRRYEIDEEAWTPWQLSNPLLVLETNSVTLTTNGKTGFVNNRITKCRITASLTGAPEGKGGMLTTDKTSGHDYYIYQTYEPVDGANLYRRYWLQGTSVWGDWLRVTPLALTTTQRNGGSLVRNVGDMIFDTTLGKPVWLKTQPNIWVDAIGATV